MNINNQLDFFIGFLEKQNQNKTTKLIKNNKEKIAYYFNKMNKNINKCYKMFDIFNNKLYLHFRSNKEQPFKHYSIDLEKIKEIKINNKYQLEKELENSTYEIPKLERI